MFEEVKCVFIGVQVFGGFLVRYSCFIFGVMLGFFFVFKFIYGFFKGFEQKFFDVEILSVYVLCWGWYFGSLCFFQCEDELKQSDFCDVDQFLLRIRLK